MCVITSDTLEAVAKTSSAFENPALKPRFRTTSLIYYY
jgi:hypothetical protein